MSNLSKYIYSATPTEKAQEKKITGEGAERMQEPEDQDDCYGIVSSRQALPQQGLHRDNPS